MSPIETVREDPTAAMLRERAIEYFKHLEVSATVVNHSAESTDNGRLPEPAYKQYQNSGKQHVTEHEFFTPKVVPHGLPSHTIREQFSFAA